MFENISHRKLRLFAAVVTPCNRETEPDYFGMGKLCAHLVSSGCDGLFILGSTGELPLLDEDQRRRLIAAARQGAPDVPLYAGVTGTGLRQTLHYCKVAAEEGADAGIAMAPFFLCLDQAQLLAYGVHLAENSPIPLGFYHHLRMPSAFEVDTVAALAEHENVLAFKETSRDETRFKSLAKVLRAADLSLYQGNENLIYSSLMAGGSGAVSALANVIPELHRDLFAAWQAGKLHEAEQLQQQINNVWEAFRWPEAGKSFPHFLYILKYLLAKRGWIRNTAVMVPGFAGDPVLEERLNDLLARESLWPEGISEAISSKQPGSGTTDW